MNDVESILDSDCKVFVIATGAGAGIQKALWDVPGISSVFVGASFPYSTEQTDEILGFKPDKYASDETAIDLAHAAYMKAWSPGVNAIGLGLTASVASNREHRGDHRVHLALISQRGTQVLTVQLKKGVGSEQRKRDGDYCDKLALRLLASEAAGTGLKMGILPEEYLGSSYITSDTADVKSRARFFARPFFYADGTRTAIPPTGKSLTLFPGAFNPPHEGHFGIADTMDNWAHLRVTFEITTDSAHKPALSVVEMLQRAKLLQGRSRLFTQGCPLFVDKAKRFPGAGLVLGADAMLRMYDPKWCSDAAKLTATFMESMTTFYAFGRKLDDGFVSSQDLLEHLPPGAQGLSVTHVRGRWDVSSSALRKVT